MRLLQLYRSKKYLSRLLLSVTAFMVAALVFASLALQVNAERNAVKLQLEANRKVMSQIRLNIASMTEVLDNLALSLYMDPNIVSLFTLREPDEMTVIRSTHALNQAYLSLSFLHSILVYNGFENQTYTVGELNANKPDAAMATRLTERLRQTEKLPRLRLLPMNFGGREGGVDFLSLVLYQNFAAANTDNESAIAVNIKPEWLYDNLRSVNDFALPDRSGLFILDQAGNVILSGNDHALPDGEKLRAALAKHAAADEPFGSFSGRLGGGEKQLVTYLDLPDAGWKVVSVQPYEVVLGGVRQLRATSVLVIGAILLLAVAMSVVVSHKLYAPIERLLRQLGLEPGSAAAGTGAPKDELAAVASEYRSMAEKLDGAFGEQDKQKRIVKNYYLRALLESGSGSSSSAEEFADQLERNGLRIGPDGPYRVALIRVDRSGEFIRSTTRGERTLYAFAIGNIAEEIMRRGRFRCEIADMRGDHMAMLVSPESGAGEDREELLRRLRLVQETVSGYYKLSLTVTVSDACDRFESIAERYGEALQLSQYKLLFGHGAVITPELVRANERRLEYLFPEEAEKRLVESIRVNHLTDMESAVSDILRELSGCHYDHIVHGILHIVDLIKATVRDINRNRVVSLGIDLSRLSRRALEAETMEELGALFRGVCRDIHEKLHRTEGEKNAALIDAIKEIVELNYKDRNLSLQGIAAMLHLTPAYVGRMFKTSEHVSVAEYLNEVRLRHAQGYLETKSFSVKEIMELVGYVNESTFFKLFKKSFGVTPKEYRLKKTLEA